MKKVLTVLAVTGALLVPASAASATVPDPITNHSDVDGNGNFLEPTYGNPTTCSIWKHGRSKNFPCVSQRLRHYSR